MSEEKWIQSAIKRPGSLRRWLKRHEAEIKRYLGTSPFNRDGTIKMSVLRRLHANKDLLKRIAKSHWRRIWHKIHLAIFLKSRHK